MKGPGWVAAQGDNYGLVVNRRCDASVFFYIHDGSKWREVSSGDVAILDGKWHHVAGAFDHAAGRLIVYKDGSWFGYGIISIEGTIYATASKTHGTHWSGP